MQLMVTTVYHHQLHRLNFSQHCAVTIVIPPVIIIKLIQFHLLRAKQRLIQVVSSSCKTSGKYDCKTCGEIYVELCAKIYIFFVHIFVNIWKEMIFFGAERMFTTILGKNIFLIPGEHISRRNMLPIFEKYAPNILEEICFQYYKIICILEV